jgi:hypothetical protein
MYQDLYYIKHHAAPILILLEETKKERRQGEKGWADCSINLLDEINVTNSAMQIMSCND